MKPPQRYKAGKDIDVIVDVSCDAMQQSNGKPCRSPGIFKHGEHMLCMAHLRIAQREPPATS